MRSLKEILEVFWIMKIKMYAKAEVHPTEDPKKVIEALGNIFDYDVTKIEEGCVFVSGGVESLMRFRESLEKRRIRSTAKSVMMRGSKNNTISFLLSKQAAFVGVPNFVEDRLSALGEIEVTIKTDDLERFIDWIAPA